MTRVVVRGGTSSKVKMKSLAYTLTLTPIAWEPVLRCDAAGQGGGMVPLPAASIKDIDASGYGLRRVKELHPGWGWRGGVHSLTIPQSLQVFVRISPLGHQVSVGQPENGWPVVAPLFLCVCVCFPTRQPNAFGGGIPGLSLARPVRKAGPTNMQT